MTDQINSIPAASTEARLGFSTGACAAAAALAAALLVRNKTAAQVVTLDLPDGPEELPVAFAEMISAHAARAGVRKDAGGDLDVTHGALIIAEVACAPTGGIVFRGGEGVGTITLPGLQFPPGEPAINPAPRKMIAAALATVGIRDAVVTICVPGGAELAQKTFNPRLGILGGISIIGTSGRVHPFSRTALRESVGCALRVAAANLPPSGCADFAREGALPPLALVPGHYGFAAAQRLLGLPQERIVEVGNEWDYALPRLRDAGWTGAVLVGHPGKLAKIADGHPDTHSKNSPPALTYIRALAQQLAIACPQDFSGETAEGFFAALGPDERKKLADGVARETALAASRLCGLPCAAILINMQSAELGRSQLERGGAQT